MGLIRPISLMLLIPHVGAPSAPLNLAQPWLDTPESGFQSATVRLSWSDTNLHVHLELTDFHPFSASTEHGQSLHLLGDTIEVFLMLPDAPQYYEFHVSLNNHRALLRWPLGSIDAVRRDGLSLSDFQENPDTFDSRVAHGESDGSWEVTIDIPHTVLGLEHFVVGQPLLISVCRYDYEDLDTPPVLSTIAAHPVKNFHRIAEWLSAELV